MNKRVDNSQWKGFSLLVHWFPGRHGIISAPFPTNITQKGAITNVTRRFVTGNLKRVLIVRLKWVGSKSKVLHFFLPKTGVPLQVLKKWSNSKMIVDFLWFWNDHMNNVLGHIPEKYGLYSYCHTFTITQFYYLEWHGGGGEGWGQGVIKIDI